MYADDTNVQCISKSAATLQWNLDSNFKSNDLMALENYSKLKTKIQQIQNEMQQTKTEFLTYRTNTSQDLSQLSQGM